MIRKKFPLLAYFIWAILLLLIPLGCASDPPRSEDEKTAANYVESQGYEIEDRQGKVYTYTLDKSLLQSVSASATGNLPYIQIWSLQENDREDYFGKEISSYIFTVSGHPLDKKYNTNTIVNIMMSDGEVIGGTSTPDVGGLDGSLYSLDGRTLEEVTGISYGEWRTQWAQKYTD
ncbi:MAG: DUF4830 domain-containing protein [Bacillota bacterium]